MSFQEMTDNYNMTVNHTNLIPIGFEEHKKLELDILIYHFGNSPTPDQLDQTWVNCLNLFGVEYNA
jgi:hypothetical protein